jgi:hypothetical protein
MLARIPPRDTTETLAVLDFLEVQNYMARSETSAILRNLVLGPNRRGKIGPFAGQQQFSGAQAANDDTQAAAA